MFRFIRVNYLNVSLMDFVFLEPSVFFYIHTFQEMKTVLLKVFYPE